MAPAISSSDRLCARLGFHFSSTANPGRVGPRFQAALRRFAGHPAVAEVRGVQLIGALELRRPPSGPFASAAPNSLGPAVYGLGREEGIIVRGLRDLVAIAPPLVITHAELDRLFAALGRALDRFWG